MNDSIKIIRATHGIKGRYPRYTNLWSFAKIAKYLNDNGVPQSKIDTLLEIYQTLRSG